MCGSFGGGIPAAAPAAGPGHRPPDRGPPAVLSGRAALLRQPCTGRCVHLGAGKPAGALWPEDDPCPALGDVPEAEPPARRHTGRAEPRRGGRPLFGRCGHGGGSIHFRHHQHGGRCLPHHLHHGGHCSKKYRPCADPAAGAATVCRVYPSCPEADAGRAAGQPPRGRRSLRAGARDSAQHPHHPGAGAGGLHGAPV